MKKILKWCVIGIVVLGILGAIFGGDEKGTSTETTETVSTSTKKEEPAKIFAIGDEVRVGNLTYKVEGKEVKKQVGDQYINQIAQGEYLILKVSVTNNDKEARTLDTSLFKLTDSEGRTYDPDATADIYVNGQNMFFLDKINPNLTKTGYIVFDLADPNAEYILNVTGGMFSREKEAISLK